MLGMLPVWARRPNPAADHKRRTLPDLHYDRELEMAKAIGSWGFSAHEYSEDELVHAAFLMLQHALAMPQLDNWRLPTGRFFLIDV